MSNKKSIMTTWVMIVGLTFIALVMIASGLQETKTSSPVKKPIARPAKQSPQVVQQDLLKLLSYNCYSEHGYFHITGEVKNISDKSLEDVVAVGIAYTESGEFVKSDDALIDYNPILSGQTSPFEILMTDNPAIKKCKVDFKEFFGGSIPTKK